MTIEVRQGDTVQLTLNLTNNGEPFVPTDEKIVFSARLYKALFPVDGWKTSGSNYTQSVAVTPLAGAPTISSDCIMASPVCKTATRMPPSDVEVFFLAKKGE